MVNVGNFTIHWYDKWCGCHLYVGKSSSPTGHMGYVKKSQASMASQAFGLVVMWLQRTLTASLLTEDQNVMTGEGRVFNNGSGSKTNKVNKCSATRSFNTKGGEQEGDEGVYLELGTCVWIRPIWWKKSTMKSHRRKLHKPAWRGWKFCTWNLSMERDLLGLKGPKCGLVVVLVCTVSGMKKREGVLAPNWFLILRSWRNFPVILGFLLGWCFFRLYHGIHRHLAPPFWDNIFGSHFPFASWPVANPRESTKKNKLFRVSRGWNPTQLYGKLR